MQTENKLLEVFYLNPMSRFHIRELARETGLDTKTVMKYMDAFAKKGIILRKKEKGGFPHYEANRESLLYRYKKSQIMTERLYESGIIERLEKELNPKVIILFGSVRKGTYHEKSDIDIFVQAKKKKISLSYYEKRLKRKVGLLFEENLNRLSKGLLQNIYNGIVLSGELEI